VIVAVPPVEPGAAPWPSLGWHLVPWMEESLVFGPGDLLGTPLVLSDMRRWHIFRWYEVWPRDHRLAGRRRFSRAGLSLPKGVGKTELAAIVTAAELHPAAPVRCVDWTLERGEYVPVGGPVFDPYIPIVAFTEGQAELGAYGALKEMLRRSPVESDFDIGEERITRRSGDGRAEPLATAPSSNDGQRTTFQVGDETHHWVLERHKKAHQTMLLNLTKRQAADPWALEVTTSFSLGEGSVAEDAMELAEGIAKGRAKNAQFCFFHREAGEHHDLSTREGVLAALEEAYGDDGFTNREAAADRFFDSKADRTLLIQRLLNRRIRVEGRVFDLEQWRALGKAREIPSGAEVTLGFSGSRSSGAGLIATEVATGHQAVVATWEKPHGDAPWTVREDEVTEAVDAAVARWRVWRCHADPRYFDTLVSHWAGKHGDDVFVFTQTKGPKFAAAFRVFLGAVASGEVTHDGAPEYERHVGDTFRRALPAAKDEDGEPMWVPAKERHDSENRIFLTVAGILSWEARIFALQEGIGASSAEPVGAALPAPARQGAGALRADYGPTTTTHPRRLWRT
jgi:hypothetical protein